MRTKELIRHPSTFDQPHERAALVTPQAYGVDFIDALRDGAGSGGEVVQRLAAPSSSSPLSPPGAHATGLPDGLRAGMEQLSGLAMGDVRVHRGSAEPAALGALAFTRGRDIHLGPGQERHLAHEAWHVVQQRQGRVRATAQFAGVAGNADEALEREADAVAEAVSAGRSPPELNRMAGGDRSHSPVVQRKLAGSAAALRGKGGKRRSRLTKDSFDKLRHLVKRYERREMRVIDGQGKPESLLPLLAQIADGIETYLDRHGSTTRDEERCQALRTLLVRVRVESVDIENGTFHASPGAHDAILHSAKDNAVGGKLNKLDRLKYNDGRAGFYKPESYGANTSDAGLVGIPDADPNYSGRSVASNIVDRHIIDILNANRHDDDHELPSLAGSELANHTRVPPGGGKAVATTGLFMDTAPGEEVLEGLVAPGKMNFAGSGHGSTGLADPTLMRELNKLQWLDALCGQIDRHAKNYFARTDASGAVQQLTGIDNDMAFGKDMTSPDASQDFPWVGRHYKGMPIFADDDYARALSQIVPEDLGTLLRPYLSDEEVAATLARLAVIKRTLMELAQAGKLVGRDEWSTNADQLARAQLEHGENYLSTIGAAMFEGEVGDIKTPFNQAWQTAHDWKSIVSRAPDDPVRQNFCGYNKFVNAFVALVDPLVKAWVAGRFPRDELDRVMNETIDAFIAELARGTLFKMLGSSLAGKDFDARRKAASRELAEQCIETVVGGS